jgi:glycosyltransferase involved in cell wall biosynthesis
MLLQKPFTVVFFYRKPRPTGNSSIEFLFDTIRSKMPSHIKPIKKVSRFYSNGLFKRIYITIEASLKQGDVNHVTGDVHFLTLFLKKKRTVVTIHDCVFMKHPSYVARFIFKWFWLRLPAWRASIITVVSQTTKDEVLKYVKCDEKKIRIAPVFISEKFKSSPKAFNVIKPTILHIGVSPNKNLERLIEALNGLACKLVIVGKLNALHKELLKKNRIDFTNSYNIAEEEVIHLFEECDMLAFVSTYEGFGMPILEAQTVGRPVVTANISSMPEVAADGACFVDPFNVNAIRFGIEKIINDENYRADIVKKGWENIKRYSVHATASRYARLYEELRNQ